MARSETSKGRDSLAVEEFADFQSRVRDELGYLRESVDEIKSDVSELKSDVSELKSDVSEIKDSLREIRDHLKMPKPRRRTGTHPTAALPLAAKEG